jgi:hypothetical protein
MAGNLAYAELPSSDRDGAQFEAVTDSDIRDASEVLVCGGILQDVRLRTDETYFGVTRPAPEEPQTAEGLTGFYDESEAAQVSGNVRLPGAWPSNPTYTSMRQREGRALLHLVGRPALEVKRTGGITQDQNTVAEYRKNLAHSHGASIPGTVRHLDTIEADKQPRHGVNANLGLGLVFAAAKSYLRSRRGRHA